MVKLNCQYCNKEFEVIKQRKDIAKWCSIQCLGFSRKGKLRDYKPTKETNLKISAALTGVKHSDERRKRKSEINKKLGIRPPSFFSEEHHAWKGENVGYIALHSWIYRNLGKASKCVVCDGRESQSYQWANISGLYKRDVKDFIQLCASCHQKYDFGKRKFNLNKFISGKI